MPSCEVCKNDYDKLMEISIDGKIHFFDCFECAIQALAPLCACCDCKIIGHGVETGGSMYCSAHCAKAEGHEGVADRA